jgi:membrane-associated phospholipid phosphatase
MSEQPRSESLTDTPRRWVDELSREIPRPSTLVLRDGRVVVGLLAGTGLLGLVARFGHEQLLRVDRPISEAVRGEAYQDLFRTITRWGGQQETLPFMLVVALAVAFRCKPTAVAYPVAGLLGLAADAGLKLLIRRPRPPDPDVGVALSSFPSGHAIHGVLLFGLLVPVGYILTRHKAVGWMLASLGLVAIPLVGYSRVYLGAHWPTDIVGSLVIGLLLLLTVEYALASRLAGRFCGGCPLHHLHRLERGGHRLERGGMPHQGQAQEEGPG